MIVKHEMEDFSSVAQQYIVSKLRLILDVLQEERDGFMARVQSQIADLTNLVDTK